MTQRNTIEVERKIGYWQRTLSKIKGDMLYMQSKCVDIHQKLAHLSTLREKDVYDLGDVN